MSEVTEQHRTLAKETLRGIKSYLLPGNWQRSVECVAEAFARHDHTDAVRKEFA